MRGLGFRGKGKLKTEIPIKKVLGGSTTVTLLTVFTVVIFKHTDPTYEWNKQNVAAVVAVWGAITTAIVWALGKLRKPAGNHP